MNLCVYIQTHIIYHNIHLQELVKYTQRYSGSISEISYKSISCLLKYKYKSIHQVYAPNSPLKRGLFSFRSVPCILIKVSVGGKISPTTRLLPFSCFVGTGVLTHTWVSESTKQRQCETHTHKKPHSFVFFSSAQTTKRQGGIYTLPLYPLQTTNDISLLTSSSPHPEPLTWFRREQSALLKDFAVSLKAALCCVWVWQARRFLILLTY